MKTLRWIGRFITAVAVALTVRWISSNSDFLPIFYFAYPTQILLGIMGLILLILAFCSLEIFFNTRIKLKEVFDVSKPVKKLTPDDFHITNYNKFYIERESDKEIRDRLEERKYAFITGIPMLGKTRMAYESVKKLKGFYLLKPQYKEIDVQKLKLPFFKKKIVLFLDDLDKYVGKFNLDDLVRKLKEKAQDFVVIATCRSGKEFDQVFARKEMEMLLTQCQKGKTEPRLLKQEEGRKLAEAVSKRLEEIKFDGTPGSIVIDLRYMKKRYENLGDEKYILKCLKLLREGRIFLWTEALVKESSKKIFGLHIKRTEWDNYIKSLVDNGFIKRYSDIILISHGVYLDDSFLDDYSIKEADLVGLKDILFQSKDFWSLFFLGYSFHHRKNFHQEMDCYQKSVRVNPDFVGAQILCTAFESVEEYKEALRVNPNLSDTHCNLGKLFLILNRKEEAKKEFEIARDLFRKQGREEDAKKAEGFLKDL